MTQSFNITDKHYIGKQKTKTVLDVFGLKIPLYLGSEKGEYDSEYKKIPLKLFKNEIPIILHKRQFVYYKTEKGKIDYEKACEMLNERLEKEYPNAAKSRELYQNGDCAELKAIISEERDISVSQSLIFSVGK